MTISDQLKGVRLGGYEIGRVIGHGATATVFDGKHVALGKPVAIKILHEHLADNALIRERFLQEGRIAARLRHPNIVDVIDVGADGPMPYLVMDLLSGTDLRKSLDESGPLKPAPALALVLPIASALAHAHDAGVVHRDLKPSNIFLARDMRGDVVPTLVDFGLSKAGGDASSLTQTALIAGTVLYMAPEQTYGMKGSTPASDQYSLAAILYEAMTGRPPFEGSALIALLERIRTEDVVSPSALSAHVPAALADAVLQALKREPADRFTGMRAFGAALLPFADEAHARVLRRDFTDHAAAASAPSRPSVRRAARQEPPDPPASRPSPARQSVAGRATAATASLPCPAGASPFHIKGLAYRGFVHLVNRTVPGGLDSFADAVTDESLRPFLRQPFLAGARYDVLPFVPLFATLAQLLGANFGELVRSATAGQCRYDGRTVYRAIFSSDSVGDIATRFSRFCSQYYDFGRYVGSLPQPNHLVVVHGEIPEYVSAWLIPMGEAYTEECMKILGAREVRLVSSTSTPAGRTGPFPLVTLQTEFAWTD